jgi:hypothetical protein
MNSYGDVLRLEKALVLDLIGYGNAERPSRRVISLVDDHVRNYHDYITPSCSYARRHIVCVDGNTIRLDGGHIIKSAVLSRLLSRCESAVIFVATIGGHLEEIARQEIDNGRNLCWTILDAIGSGAVEKLAALVEKEIRQAAFSRNRFSSRRFSPGYCDWDIHQQNILFDILGDDTAGVELTEGMLMTPQKSVSGIIGIGTNHEITHYNPCTTCRRQDCPGRRR